MSNIKTNIPVKDEERPIFRDALVALENQVLTLEYQAERLNTRLRRISNMSEDSEMSPRKDASGLDILDTLRVLTDRIASANEWMAADLYTLERIVG